MSPVIGILALQGAVELHARAVSRLGLEPVEVRTPAQLDTVDALILPGGESSTISKLLVINGLLEPLQARLDDGMAALGTCAGMILLATGVLDGRADQRSFAAIDIDVRRNAFGRQNDSFETDLPVSGIDGPDLHAVFIRAPIVERVGPGVEVLAIIDDERAVACRQGPVIVTSFHPELSADLRVHELFLSGVAA
ncbi:MAG: pyridoxal 5'-phosphate synthase glutaminase subunit PdxT [Actinobacteria bacterium]|nr:pyridoxal 5'-phosphate synthase glutaminase subunit PdxT [Actinomycetota bacterium]